MSTRFKDSKTFKVDAFDTILADANVRVIVKTGAHFQVITQASRGVKLSAKVESSELKITQDGHSKNASWWKHLTGMSSFDDDYFATSGFVTVYVPESSSLKGIKQTDNNHDIQLNGITFDGDLDLHGTLKIDDVTANSIKIDAGDDDVEINDSKFTASVSSINSKDGDFDLKHVTFAELTTFNLTDGDVRMDNVTVLNGSTVIKTEDGDLDLNHDQFDDLKIVTEGGDVEFNALTIKTKLKINTDDGDVVGTMKSDDDVHIITSTTDGDVMVLPVSDDNSKKEYYIVTDLGDITIS